MTDIAALRIQGVYPQRQTGCLMVRVKIPFALSSREAKALAEIAGEFTPGTLHLTTRGSIELHGVGEEDAERLLGALNAAGLTTRGACGGAVRGVSCGRPDAESFLLAGEVARRLHRKFTGHPAGEGLPKKFKLGVFTGSDDNRYLIQDAALVLCDPATPLFHVWGAGGLGREPREAFPLAAAVTEEAATALVEKMVALYRERVPAGKRLKHLVQEIGREEFCSLLGIAPPGMQPATDPSPRTELFLEVSPFAGELPAAELRRVAEIAERHAGGALYVTADQNLALRPGTREAREAALRELADAGLPTGGPPRRICPGSHECRMGLVPTRDIALALLTAFPSGTDGKLVALSGCPNSCSHPQLAGIGMAAVRGGAEPLFDLYVPDGEGGLSRKVRERLPLSALPEAVAGL